MAGRPSCPRPHPFSLGVLKSRSQLYQAPPPPCGVKFEEIRLENIGPISRASISRHRLSVLIGPNNSGKSIAARVMHGVRRLDPAATAQEQDPGGAGGPGGGKDGQSDAVMSNAILRGAGIRRRDIVTHALPSGRLEIAGGGPPVRLDFGRGTTAGGDTPPHSPAPCTIPADSVYVPAGRVGIVQSMLDMLRAKSRPSNSAPDAAAGAGPERAPGGAAALRPTWPVPEHLGQFHSAVLEAVSGGLSEEARATFSSLFGGSLDMVAAGGPPALRYRDPSGFEVEAGLAGSGALSAFPVVAALHGVEPGGALAVEEVEAHMEPLGQTRFAIGMVRAALSRRVDLVLATHSDYVVNGVLNMVHDGAIGPDDLGLYYFRRKRGAFTRVERIAVDGTGEAEQELFEEALDALAKGGAGNGS